MVLLSLLVMSVQQRGVPYSDIAGLLVVAKNRRAEYIQSKRPRVYKEGFRHARLARAQQCGCKKFEGEDGYFETRSSEVFMSSAAVRVKSIESLEEPDGAGLKTTENGLPRRAGGCYKGLAFSLELFLFPTS